MFFKLTPPPRRSRRGGGGGNDGGNVKDVGSDNVPLGGWQCSSAVARARQKSLQAMQERHQRHQQAKSR